MARRGQSGLRHAPERRKNTRKGRYGLPPLVVDGDALNILAEWKDWQGHVPASSVLTPHPGEMGRLVDATAEEVQADRVNVAKKAAAEWRQVVVLKGAGTVIAAPDGRIFVSPFSNPAQRPQGAAMCSPEQLQG